MLSQTKMQLWYPKRSTEECSDNNMVTFQSRYEKNGEAKREKIQRDRGSSPTNSERSDGNEEVDVEFLSEDCSSRGGSCAVSDCDEEIERKRKKGEQYPRVSDFVDLDYWRKETICCGTIFRGIYDEVIVDPSFLRPCRDRIKQSKMQISKGNVDEVSRGNKLVCLSNMS
ncbi:hypothetical protein NQ318_000370 [Aromia moschata]|uniref:Uncharacterized protein n=1 Tax=Aromia moschata TaxID=1265417 RepID=A0AAV8YTV2_9CUCU|nr:hypothetical protein NQ318_000370 [Aromia moschata]